ncbi:enolase-phosphatase E1 [Exaiptasia diaphana]|uniref:Uncharacterized protein n=1 Tax=Exaiptasia diaphana TaxID=2652724 RepID=A0A913XGB5_EXADI|nr:enolase-phosphatase E1 [Exaiptasia diaphana]
MFENFNLKTVLIGGAIIGGLATVGYVTYKLFTMNNDEKIDVDGKFGEFDVSSAEREKRVLNKARKMSIVDPKSASCVISSDHMTRVNCTRLKDFEEIAQEENGETQITEKSDETERQMSCQVERNETTPETASENLVRKADDDVDGKEEEIKEEESKEEKKNEGEEEKDERTIDGGGTQKETEEEQDNETQITEGNDTKCLKSPQVERNESTETTPEAAPENLVLKEEDDVVGKEEETNEGKEEKDERTKDGGEAQKETEEEQHNEARPAIPLDTEAASGSHSTNQPMPGLYIPSVLKNVKTMRDLMQTMEALSIFLFTTQRTQEELDEARRELGWTVLIGGAVIGGLATVGYVTYKLFTMNNDENIVEDGKFGEFDVSSAEREKRVLKKAHKMSIVDPKTASCVISSDHMTRVNCTRLKDFEEIAQEENGETQITEGNDTNCLKSPQVERNESTETTPEAAPENLVLKEEDDVVGKEEETNEGKEEKDERTKHGGEAQKETEEEQHNEARPAIPLDTEAASGSHSTNQPMPGLYIPSVLKNVKTMRDLMQTMEALSIFLFTTQRTQEELDEARRELGWVFDLAKGFFIHRIPELGIPGLSAEREPGMSSHYAEEESANSLPLEDEEGEAD